MLDKSSKIVNFNIGRILSLFSTKQGWNGGKKRSYTKTTLFSLRQTVGMNQTSPIQAFVILQTVHFAPKSYCSTILVFLVWNQDDFLSVASLTCSHLREPGREKSLSFGTAAKEHQITVQPETQTQLLQSVCQILRFDVQGCRVFFFSLPIPI